MRPARSCPASSKVTSASLVERSAPGDELSADAVHDTLGLLTAVDRGDTTLAGWLADAKRAGASRTSRGRISRPDARAAGR